MRKGSSAWWLSSLLPLLLVQARGVPAQDAAAPGVVVEDVAKDSAADRAGMLPGDVIVSWTRRATPPVNSDAPQGPIASPFDLAEVEVEQGPRGTVGLAGRRGPLAMTWLLPPVPFGARVRPELESDLLTPYQEGEQLVQAKKVSEGSARFWAAAESARDRGASTIAAWLFASAAKAWSSEKIWMEADAAYEEAVRSAESGPSSGVTAQLLRQWADVLRTRSEWALAEERYGRALALQERRGSESLAVAQIVNNLGSTVSFRGDLAGAETNYRRALDIRRKLAPGSLTEAASLNNIGGLAWHRGDLALAEEHFRATLAIEAQLVPDSLDIAMTLNNLGIVARASGDLAVAQDFHGRALAIREKRAPGSLDVAASLKNLGVVARNRGELATAEDYYTRALTIEEELAPGSLSVARSLGNLGVVANGRGDPSAAEDYCRRALAIEEKLAPEGLDYANSLGTLGEAAIHRGDLVLAEQYFRRSLEVKERQAPGSLSVASELSYLGTTLKDRGELKAAEECHHRALEIRSKLAPGTSDEAESLHELGVIDHRAGRATAAAERFLHALDALESQRTRLGGTEEARSSFVAKYARYYHDAIETLVALGREAEALHVLERSRARSFLALLAERDLPWSADLSPELARERTLADAEYDRVQARIARLKPVTEDAEIQKALGRLRELRGTQEGIAARIRSASPRFASLQYPEPLDFAGVRGVLDPGQLLLAYSVGAERSVLFAVQPAPVPGPGLFVFVLPVGETALRDKVEKFRSPLRHPVPTQRAALVERAADLYDILIRPAETVIGTSERVVVSADGPLHSLPFAALVRRDPKKSPTYFIESKPLHVVPSATVYGELKKGRRQDASPSPARLVAFGDPRYPAASVETARPPADPDLREVVRSFPLRPLPLTRREVERVAVLFRNHAETYLGDQATEERAKALDRGARYVHFACHGFLDERFPLNSGLALAIPDPGSPGRDNGLLQAWEIFDQMRIDADLVTLSACGTALGKEMGGEGLMGLTRAFHYAGARSVLATLWGVSDVSTPLLMERFYTHLTAGKSRDRALQAAQIDFIRRDPSVTKAGIPDVSHPFRWAAFELSGDWR